MNQPVTATLLGIHHVAYRCRDSQETVDFYTQVLGAKYNAAHRARTRHADQSEMLHTFFQLQDGSHIAFFELPELAPQGWDPHTPRWVQHIAFRVDGHDTQNEIMRRLKERGIPVDGPKNGPTCCSIYFEDPSGNRLEVAVPHQLDAGAWERKAHEELARWNVEKQQLSRRQEPFVDESIADSAAATMARTHSTTS